MGKGDWTFIVAPSRGGAARKLEVRRSAAKWAACALAALLAILGITALHYFHMWKRAGNHDRLQREVGQLRRENASFRQQARNLADRYSFLETDAKKLEVMAASVQDTLSAGGAENTVKLALDLDSRRNVKRHVNAFDRKRINSYTEFDRLQSRYSQRALLLTTSPSARPVAGYLSGVYGRREDPFTGRGEFHPGIDISAPRGTPVRATADGWVKRGGWTSDFGKLVELGHPFGLRTRYGHLSEIAVEAGREVRRGDIIGYVGTTGRSTGPHVHYEIRLGDQPLDPLAFIED